MRGNMKEIFKRYPDQKTPKGDFTCEYANDNENEVVMWALGYDDDQDDGRPPPRIENGIARIIHEDGEYFVAWNPTQRHERTYMTKDDADDKFTSFDALCTALDEVIPRYI